MLLEAMESQAPSSSDAPAPASAAPGSGATWLAVFCGLLLQHTLELVEGQGVPHECVRSGVLQAVAECCEAVQNCSLELSLVSEQWDEQDLASYARCVSGLMDCVEAPCDPLASCTATARHSQLGRTPPAAASCLLASRSVGVPEVGSSDCGAEAAAVAAAGAPRSTGPSTPAFPEAQASSSSSSAAAAAAAAAQESRDPAIICAGVLGCIEGGAGGAGSGGGWARHPLPGGSGGGGPGSSCNPGQRLNHVGDGDDDEFGWFDEMMAAREAAAAAAAAATAVVASTVHKSGYPSVGYDPSVRGGSDLSGSGAAAGGRGGAPQSKRLGREGGESDDQHGTQQRVWPLAPPPSARLLGPSAPPPLPPPPPPRATLRVTSRSGLRRGAAGASEEAPQRGDCPNADEEEEKEQDDEFGWFDAYEVSSTPAAGGAGGGSSGGDVAERGAGGGGAARSDRGPGHHHSMDGAAGRAPNPWAGARDLPGPQGALAACCGSGGPTALVPRQQHQHPGTLDGDGGGPLGRPPLVQGFLTGPTSDDDSSSSSSSSDSGSSEDGGGGGQGDPGRTGRRVGPPAARMGSAGGSGDGGGGGGDGPGGRRGSSSRRPALTDSDTSPSRDRDRHHHHHHSFSTAHAHVRGTAVYTAGLFEPDSSGAARAVLGIGGGERGSGGGGNIEDGDGEEEEAVLTRLEDEASWFFGEGELQAEREARQQRRDLRRLGTRLEGMLGLGLPPAPALSAVGAPPAAALGTDARLAAGSRAGGITGTHGGLVGRGSDCGRGEGKAGAAAGAAAAGAPAGLVWVRPAGSAGGGCGSGSASDAPGPAHSRAGAGDDSIRGDDGGGDDDEEEAVLTRLEDEASWFFGEGELQAEREARQQRRELRRLGVRLDGVLGLGLPAPTGAPPAAGSGTGTGTVGADTARVGRPVGPHDSGEPRGPGGRSGPQDNDGDEEDVWEQVSSDVRRRGDQGSGLWAGSAHGGRGGATVATAGAVAAAGAVPAAGRDGGALHSQDGFPAADARPSPGVALAAAGQSSTTLHTPQQQQQPPPSALAPVQALGMENPQPAAPAPRSYGSHGCEPDGGRQAAPLNALTRIVCTAAASLAHGRDHEMRLAAAAVLLLLRPLVPSPPPPSSLLYQWESQARTREQAPDQPQEQAQPQPQPQPQPQTAPLGEARPGVRTAQEKRSTAAATGATTVTLVEVSERVRVAAAALKYDRCVLTVELMGRVAAAAAAAAGTTGVAAGAVRGVCLPLASLSPAQAALAAEFFTGPSSFPSAAASSSPTTPSCASASTSTTAPDAAAGVSAATVTLVPESAAPGHAAASLSAVFYHGAIQSGCAARGTTMMVVRDAEGLVAASSDAQDEALAARLLTALQPHLQPPGHCPLQSPQQQPQQPHPRLLVLASGHVPDRLSSLLHQLSGGTLLALGSVGLRAVRAGAAACGVAPAASLSLLSSGRNVARCVDASLVAGGLDMRDYRPGAGAGARSGGGDGGPHAEQGVMLRLMPGARGALGDGGAVPPPPLQQERPGWVTVVLAHPVRSELETQAAAFRTCFNRLVAALRCGRLLPGAGAWELAAAQHLSLRADQLERQQAELEDEEEEEEGEVPESRTEEAPGPRGEQGVRLGARQDAGSRTAAADQKRKVAASASSSSAADATRQHLPWWALEVEAAQEATVRQRAAYLPLSYRAVAGALRDVVHVLLQNGGYGFGEALAAAGACTTALRAGDAGALSRLATGGPYPGGAGGPAAAAVDIAASSKVKAVSDGAANVGEVGMGAGSLGMGLLEEAGSEGGEGRQLAAALAALLRLRGLKEEEEVPQHPQESPAAGAVVLRSARGVVVSPPGGLVLDEVTARLGALAAGSRLALLASSVDAVIVNR